MKKILLLEDETTIGRIYEKTLQEAGYKIKLTRTAEEAETAAENFQPDMIIIDHGIRGQEVSGLDVLPTLRKKFPAAHIMMLSNYSQTDMRQQALLAGADDYLIKINTSPKALVEYVQTLAR